MRHAALFLALVLAPAMNLAAQASALLEAGDRIRVSTTPEAPRPEWLVGTVVSTTADRLAIRANVNGHREIEVPWRSVTRLQVSRGQRSKARRGLALGVLVGAAAGAVIGSTALGDGFDLSPGNAALVGGVSGALVGGLVGLAIGSSIRSERWEDISR